MNVSRVQMSNFMRHVDSDVQLPACGIVLVTGANGEGKSSIVEAVSYAAFGETLRGTDPWPEDGKGRRVRIETTEGIWAQAEWRKRGSAVSWGETGKPEVTYETPTKAREALALRLGAFEVWRRTSVFSSSDAAHFTMSTDSERKRFLESILGLDRFDGALDECREDKKRASRAVEELRGQRLVTSTRVDAEKRRMAEASATLTCALLEDPAVLEEILKRLRGLNDAATRDLNAARAEMRKADTAGAELAVQLRSLKSTIQALRADKCPTCLQGIAPELRKSYEDKVADLERTQTEQVKAARATVADVEEQVRELEAERTALSPKIVDLERRLGVVKAQAAAIARQQATAADAKAAFEKWSAALVDTDARIVAGDVDVRTLEACDRVLGMKGVRAHVLASALGGLEAVANTWLARLAGDMRLLLRPYTETKAGKINDALAITIDGAGDGKGYRASSNGERRRIDVALLLALADVESAAYSRPPGTLFADEVFDALDADGTERAVEVLEELAEARCVVVISHSEALAKSLSPVLHLRVVGGQIV